MQTINEWSRYDAERERIIREIEDEFGTSLAELRSKCRNRRLVDARKALSYHLFRRLAMSSYEIAALIFKEDSNIRRLIKSARELEKYDPQSLLADSVRRANAVITPERPERIHATTPRQRDAPPISPYAYSIMVKHE